MKSSSLIYSFPQDWKWRRGLYLTWRGRHQNSNLGDGCAQQRQPVDLVAGMACRRYAGRGCARSGRGHTHGSHTRAHKQFSDVVICVRVGHCDFATFSPRHCHIFRLLQLLYYFCFGADCNGGFFLWLVSTYVSITIRPRVSLVE